jgi:DNA-binding NarL/FixJ family response regulator
MMVAICEQAALFREALAMVVRSRGHEVVCCVSFLGDAGGEIERCSPDVLLLGASLIDEEPVARWRRQLGLRVLLLADSGQGGTTADAIEDGLADVVIDHAAALVTLERALDGQPMAASRPRRTVAPARRADALLTTREREVIDLLLAGCSTDAIAVSLGVSGSTVHTHVQSILRKLGARSRIEAVSIYLGETTSRAG